MTTIDFIELAISNSNNYGFKLVTTTLGFSELDARQRLRQRPFAWRVHVYRPAEERR
jgi:hypothetical protein